MKKSNFRNPLLQSGALLFILLLFFSFVAGSGADSFGSGLLAIFSGIFHAILFLIGLAFSILLSIALLIVLFLAAVALYSLDKAKDLWNQLQSTLFSIIAAVHDSITLKKAQSLEIFHSQTARIHQLEKELSDLKGQNRSLEQTIIDLERQVKDLQTLSAKKREEKSDRLDTSLRQNPLNDATSNPSSSEV